MYINSTLIKIKINYDSISTSVKNSYESDTLLKEDTIRKYKMLAVARPLHLGNNLGWYIGQRLNEYKYSKCYVTSTNNYSFNFLDLQYLQLEFDSSLVDSINISSCQGHTGFNHTIGNVCSLNHDSISFNCSNTWFKKALIIDNCILYDANIQNMFLPHFLMLNNLNLKNLNGDIDLTSSIPLYDTCFLSISNVDFNKIRLRYTDFKLVFDSSKTKEEVVYVYQQLLNKLKNDGLYDSYRKLDIEFKEYKYKQDKQFFYNFIDRTWWNYGYDKSKIVTNSLWLFLLFFILNTLSYKSLTAIYYPSQFRKLNLAITSKYGNCKNKPTFLYFIARVPEIFIYTFYLFWGLRLDFSKVEINIHKPISLILLFVQYLIGVICLAYIASIILVK